MLALVKCADGSMNVKKLLMGVALLALARFFFYVVREAGDPGGAFCISVGVGGCFPFVLLFIMCGAGGIGYTISGVVSLKSKAKPSTASPPQKATEIVSPAAESTAAQVNTKFCPNCGAEIPRDSKFCKECGTRLT
jgi:ribosomal protein L40E